MSLPPISKKRTERRTRPKGAYIGSEDSFQVTAINLARSIARTAGIDPEAVMHIPNGGQRNAIVAAKLKRQGVVAGYPDIMVHSRSGMFDFDVTDAFGQFYCGLAIEIKVYPNKPTPEQLRIHDILRRSGWRVEVCYGIDEVQRAVEDYIG